MFCDLTQLKLLSDKKALDKAEKWLAQLVKSLPGEPGRALDLMDRNSKNENLKSPSINATFRVLRLDFKARLAERSTSTSELAQVEVVQELIDIMKLPQLSAAALVYIRSSFKKLGFPNLAKVAKTIEPHGEEPLPLKLKGVDSKLAIEASEVDYQLEVGLRSIQPRY
jgi:hypothetical protein